jgi:hypothetical protein
VAKEEERLRMSEKKRHSVYIDVVLAISFVLIGAAIIKGWYQDKSAASRAVLAPQVSKAATEPVKPAGYSLENIKSESGQKISAEPGDLKEVYEKFPKSDVGGNMVEGWARIKPEEKARIREALEREIETSKETLRQNPEDKKTKNLLHIAETLKALAAKDFNISPGDQSALLRSMESVKEKPRARRSDGRI